MRDIMKTLQVDHISVYSTINIVQDGCINTDVKKDAHNLNKQVKPEIQRKFELWYDISLVQSVNQLNIHHTIERNFL